MKVTVSKKSSISPKQLFSVLKKSLQEDYYQNTGQILAEENITGLSYIKRFGKNNDNSVKVRISSFIENEFYQAVFISNRGQQIISYGLNVDEDGQTLVILEQETRPKTFLQNVNERLMSFFFKKSLERQLSAQLTALINAVSS